jgi:hypothetical protein
MTYKSSVLSVAAVGLGVALAIGTVARPAALAAPAASAATTTVATVTFTEDVAPIVFNNCTSCHRPGENAPFSL